MFFVEVRVVVVFREAVVNRLVLLRRDSLCSGRCGSIDYNWVIGSSFEPFVVSLGRGASLQIALLEDPHLAVRKESRLGERERVIGEEPTLESDGD